MAIRLSKDLRKILREAKYWKCQTRPNRSDRNLSHADLIDYYTDSMLFELNMELQKMFTKPLFS